MPVFVFLAVNTNDGFVGIDSMAPDVGGSVVYAPAFDAGENGRARPVGHSKIQCGAYTTTTFVIPKGGGYSKPPRQVIHAPTYRFILSALAYVANSKTPFVVVVFRYLNVGRGGAVLPSCCSVHVRLHFKPLHTMCGRMINCQADTAGTKLRTSTVQAVVTCCVSMGNGRCLNNTTID